MSAKDVSALAIVARDLLQKGDVIGAERVLAPVFNALKADASVLHLMALIKREQKQYEEAERLLQSAVANALGEGAYYNDLGVVLEARGKFAEAARIFRAALALMPNAGVVRFNLVRCLIAGGDLAAAEQEASAYVKASPSAESWTILNSVHRAQERPEEAARSAGAALRCAPKSRAQRLTYALALERVGRAPEALPLYEGLAQENLDSADLALAYARALYGQDRKAEAEEVLERTVRVWRGAINAHGALARMRMRRGEGARATEAMEAELRERPEDDGLRLMCADVMHRGGCEAKALEVLEAGVRLAPDNPALLTARGIVLDEVGRVEEALAMFHRAVELTPTSFAAGRNLASSLLRADRPDDALTLARSMRQQDPNDQFLVACVATALRMKGDTAYERFNDYARYVRSYDIPAPRGFFTAENFNAALADALRLQHRVNAHPLEQSLHNGTQTRHTLLGGEEPNFRAFFSAVDFAVRDYVAALPNAPSDPVGRRKRAHCRYQSAWSVRLAKGGFQPNHVHDGAWISSAYYAALTPRGGGRQSGLLKFGEPHRPMRGCAPDHFIEPRVGMLVLFPSYMWHGTTVFEGEERLSMAFDIVPVEERA